MESVICCSRLPLVLDHPEALVVLREDVEHVLGVRLAEVLPVREVDQLPLDRVEGV